LGGRPSAARQVWTLRRLTPQSLGGQLSPKILIGHLCAVCNDAVDHVGTLGPSSLERALVAHLTPDQLGMLPYGQLSVSGLVGWAVAAYEDFSTPANSSPFGHLADIEALPGKLRAALGGSNLLAQT
jgi:hypothetical protein